MTIDGTLPEFRNTPDDILVSLKGVPPEDGYRVVYFDGPEDLRQYYFDYCGYEPLAAYHARHEQQHMAAATKIGGGSFRYVVRVFDTSPPEVVPAIEVSDVVLPKLALAAIAAAPVGPSESDLRQIRGLGYKGIRDVGERIIDWNARDNGLHIPVPLSHRGSSDISDWQSPRILNKLLSLTQRI